MTDEHGRSEGITARGEDLCLGGRHGDQEDTQREKKGILRTEEAFNPKPGLWGNQPRGADPRRLVSSPGTVMSSQSSPGPPGDFPHF